ncbi:MAG: amidohydrolase family protein [Thermoanaerobaculia bacterium]
MYAKLKYLIFSLIVFGGVLVIPAQAADYDLVILNGRVIDAESGLDEVRNVGVKNGKIVAVTKKAIRGRETIDASGHVVAPGFIDTHNHNVTSPFGQKLALRDGITTPLELEGGVMPVDEWYAAWEGKSQTNYGATSGVMGARELVLNPDFKSVTYGASIADMEQPEVTHATMNWSTKVATDAEIEKILSLVEEGLKQGSLGVGLTTGYMVDGITQRETFGVQKLAGKYGRLTGLHGRFSGQNRSASGMLGTDEQLGAQAAGGGGLIVQHMTAQCLSLSKYCQEMIDMAFANGVQVISEVYPYSYGATIVGADYLHPDNYENNMGHTYSDIVEIATMTPLTKERYEELLKTAPLTSVTFENATKEDLAQALAHPTSIIGSDAFPYSRKSDGSYAGEWDTPYDSVNGHPRGAGTHALVLQMVREEDLMPLMLAISKMTYLPAKFLQDNGISQMAHKGRLQVGADADITVFDPDTVMQVATPANGGLPSTGIPYVVVNGTIVVKDSKVLKGVFSGKPIRLPEQI